MTERTFKPRNRTMRIILPLLLCLQLIACASKVPLPEPPPATGGDPEAAWARVLAEYVDERGRVDFNGIADQPQDLEAWITYVAGVSPRSDPTRFPTSNDVLAYYIDAYNGLAMYGVLKSDVFPEQKVRFFLLRKYLIGGEEMSLYSLENDVIRPLGDSRVHFALNCMSVGCPRLPQTPWEAQRLDEQLEAASVEFFNADQHIRVDPVERVVYLSEILKFFTEDFLREAPTLIDYVNRYREQPVPLDYKVKFIPYDWTLNSQLSR